MRVTDSLTKRQTRIVVLALMVLGWALIAGGVSLGSALVSTAGAIVVLIVHLLLAKALLELVSTNRRLGRLEASAIATRAKANRALAGIDEIEKSVEVMGRDLRAQKVTMAGMREDVATQRRALDDLTRASAAEARRLTDVAMSLDQADASVTTLAGEIDDLRARVTELTRAHDTTRAGLSRTRDLTERLADRARRQVADESRLEAVATTEVEAPVLSVAIPSFGRPGPLGELLESIAKEMTRSPPGPVEVCISDDASQDPEPVEIALEFAERNRYASLHILPQNVGIERNVLEVGKACRGQYLLIIGNDDIVIPGALGTVLEDIRTTEAPVLLYAKRRINNDGSPRTALPGSIPIELEDDATHLFPTFIDAARAQGLLSTFGYVGPIVMRRESFMDVDPTPYIDLTMYAPLFAMVEAFAREPVFYRNRATILHRTPSPTEKHAEAVGRREEEFMTGGRARLARYFGTSLAAALQRLVDRGALDHRVLAGMPEKLMTPLPLVEWIAANRRLEPTTDERLDVSVVEDADRFFAGAAEASLP